MILFLIIFLLGTISLSAVSAYRMTRNTEENLWASLPAVVTIEEDQAALASEIDWQPGQSYFTWPTPPAITHELVEEIAELSYVRHADISLRRSLFSRNLNRHWDLEANVRDQQSLRSMRIYHLEEFDVRGVTQSDFSELNFGIIQVTAGSNFTAEHITNGMPVAIISQELASANSLAVGSFITLEEIISKGSSNISNWYDDDNIINSLAIELEVIGIYDLQGNLPEFADIHIDETTFYAGDIIAHELNMLNKIYIPYKILRQMENFAIDTMENFWHEEVNPMSVENILILNDPRNLLNFHEAAAGILPEFLTIRDVTESFENVMVAMDQIGEAAAFILIFLIGASLLLLTFLIMLLLRNRKHEIGIYLALGEEKKRVTFLFIAEVLIVAIVAAALSLFINQFVSAEISQHMVMQEMANIQVESPVQAVVSEDGVFMREVHLLDWFVPEVREIEEMIEVFDISLAVIDIFVFYGVTIFIAVSSTILSTLYIMRLKPKEILIDV